MVHGGVPLTTGACRKRLHLILWDAIEFLVPLFKRIRHKKLVHHQAIRLVRCLCEGLKSSCDEGIYYKCIYGPIISAAESGVFEVVEEIVDILPHVIWYCSNQVFDPIPHIAVQNRCERVFNLIDRMNEFEKRILSRLDDSRNSIVHLAARLAPPHKLNLVSGAALQMQRELQWFQVTPKLFWRETLISNFLKETAQSPIHFHYTYIRGYVHEVERLLHPSFKEHQNSSGETPAMVFTREHKELVIEGEKWMKDTANSCSIAAALIITIVFAAAITVPGGNNGDTGLPIFSKGNVFWLFAVSDAISLFTSTTSLFMFLSILTARYAEQDFLHALPRRLILGLLTLFLSITSMIIAFSATVYLVFGEIRGWILIPLLALSCLPITSFVTLQFPLLIDVIYSTYGHGPFGKRKYRTSD